MDDQIEWQTVWDLAVVSGFELARSTQSDGAEWLVRIFWPDGSYIPSSCWREETTISEGLRLLQRANALEAHWNALKLPKYIRRANKEVRWPV